MSPSWWRTAWQHRHDGVVVRLFGWGPLDRPRARSGELPAGMYSARIVWRRGERAAGRQAEWRGVSYRLRFNDFPREALCTLMADEVVVAELDEFPIRWSVD